MLLRSPTDNNIAVPARFRLRGAHISGVLDLGCGTVAPFVFDSCYFESQPILNDAKCEFIGFVDCYMPGLSAERVRCSGAVWLNGSQFIEIVDFTDSEVYDLYAPGARFQQGIHACGSQIEKDLVLDRSETTGTVAVDRATVGGQISLRAAKLSCPGGMAFTGYLLSAGGTVYLNDQLVAEGSVNLEGAKIDGQLQLTNCRIEQVGRIAALSLDHSVIRLGILAMKLHVVGLFRSHHAQIGCQFTLRSAKLENPEDTALQADHLTVEGALMLDGGFTSDGSIDLHGSHFECSMIMTGATISKGKAADSALSANNVTVKGNVDIRKTQIVGQCRFTGLQITGDFVASDSKISSDEDFPITLREAQISGGVFLNHDAHVKGGISLRNATVGTQVNLHGATIENPNGSSVNAIGLRLGGEFVAMAAKFDGLVDLAFARIDGSVRMSDAKLLGIPSNTSTYGSPNDLNVGERKRGVSLRATGCAVASEIDLRGAEIRHALQINKAQIGRSILLKDSVLGSSELALDVRGTNADALVLKLSTRPRGEFDLRDSTFDSLEFTELSWPTASNVHLDDLEYNSIHSDQTVRDSLILFKKLIPQYSPQPYEQLASSYSRAGDDSSARAVKHEALRRQHSRGPAAVRLWGQLQDLIIGYGYRPLRALTILAGVWLASSLWFSIWPPTCSRYGPASTGICPVKSDEHPTWDPWLYSLDQLIPVVNLGHDTAWDPTGWTKAVAYILVVSGWILTTVTISAGTRLLRRS
jgi:cytoskeletal protein CcmA (bactofilin family)